MSFRPTFSGELLRPDLSVTATEYFNAQLRDYVFSEVFPVFKTPEKRADYPCIPIEEYYKKVDTLRAERGYYSVVGFEFSMRSYSCQDFGVGVPLFPEEVNAYRSYMGAEESVSTASVDIMLRDQERKTASFISNPNNTGGNYSVTVPWTDRVNSTPLEDVITAKRLARKMGMRPNVLVISEKICEELILNQTLVRHLEPTQALHIDDKSKQLNILAQYFDIGKIVVGKAMSNLAPEGSPMELVSIWPDDQAFLIYRITNTRTLRVPTYGWTFCWDGIDYNMPGVSRIGKTQEIIVESYSEPSSSSYMYRAKASMTQATVNKMAALAITNIA